VITEKKGKSCRILAKRGRAKKRRQRNPINQTKIKKRSKGNALKDVPVRRE